MILKKIKKINITKNNNYRLDYNIADYVIMIISMKKILFVTIFNKFLRSCN